LPVTDHLLRVDDDHVITRVDVGRVAGLVTATDDVGDLDCKAAKDLPLGIHEIPFGLHGLLLGEESLHEKRGLELGFARPLSTHISAGGKQKPAPG
jgi:hypothetical protein